MTKPVTHEPYGPKDMARRRARAIVTALILGGLAIVFFVTTIVRLGGLVAERSL